MQRGNEHIESHYYNNIPKTVMDIVGERNTAKEEPVSKGQRQESGIVKGVRRPPICCNLTYIALEKYRF